MVSGPLLLAPNGLGVLTLHVRMRWCHSTVHDIHLVPASQASLGFVPRFERDLAFLLKGRDEVFIQDVSVFVSELDSCLASAKMRILCLRGHIGFLLWLLIRDYLLISLFRLVDLFGHWRCLCRSSWNCLGLVMEFGHVLPKLIRWCQPLRSDTSEAPPRGLPFRRTYISEKCVAIKIPGVHKLHLLTSILGPRVSIDQRGVEGKCENATAKEQNNERFPNDGSGSQSKTSEPVGEKVKLLGKHHNSKVERREIVVEEQLPGHEIEGEVVESPSQDAGADFVVEALEVVMTVVTAASLPPNDSDPLKKDVDTNGHR